MIDLYNIFAGKYDNNTTKWITGKCIEKHYYGESFLVSQNNVVSVTSCHLVKPRDSSANHENADSHCLLLPLY